VRQLIAADPALLSARNMFGAAQCTPRTTADRTRSWTRWATSAWPPT